MNGFRLCGRRKDVSYENRENSPASGLVLLAAGRVRKKVERANPEDYRDHPYQDVALGTVADPERIVLSKNGREKAVFERAATAIRRSPA